MNKTISKKQHHHVKVCLMMPAAEETRTLNLRITSALRCQLRHGGMCLYSYNRRLRAAQAWYRAKNRKKTTTFHFVGAHSTLWAWSERQDSNLRPSDPKSDTLPNCATPRNWLSLWDSNPGPPLYQSGALTY